MISLSAPQSFYITPTGSNSLDGLTPATAWATPQHAWDVLLSNYLLCGFKVTINLADGVYPPLVAAGLIPGTRAIDSVTFLGNTAHSNQVSISNPSGHGVLVTDNADVKFDGVQFVGAGQVWANDLCVTEGRVQLGTVVFGACPWAHMQAAGPRSRIAINSQYYYNFGSATYHVLFEQGAFVSISSTLQTLTPGYGFGTFAYGDLCAQLEAAQFSTVGQSVSGRRFWLQDGAGINTSGRGLAVLPGTLEGAQNNGYYR